MSPLTPALAVAAGAEVIEKHFTTSRNLTGPDHSFALEPDELKKMVEYVRFAERVTGHRTSRFTDSEKKFKDARRAVVAKTNIKSGEVFSTKNLTTKRPYPKGSVPAINFFGILGHRADSDVEEDTQVMKDQVKSYYESTELRRL
jgi:sialic acid synthase SpsE